MRYLVVVRDHEGVWHGISSFANWDEAVIAHRAVACTLTAIDYYDDVPPEVLKVVDALTAPDDYGTAFAYGAAAQNASKQGEA